MKIWIVWWIMEHGDTPEITVFTDHQRAKECFDIYTRAAYECDIDEYDLPGESPSVPYVDGYQYEETWWYACGSCHGAVDPGDKFCRHCGKPLCWKECKE